MHPEAPQIVRERGTAKMLGVSTAALRRWRREGRGPAFVRLERCIGYRLADLEAFLAKNTVYSAEGSHPGEPAPGRNEAV
jgi:Helix-turn-helix domain